MEWKQKFRWVQRGSDQVLVGLDKPDTVGAVMRANLSDFGQFYGLVADERSGDLVKLPGAFKTDDEARKAVNKVVIETRERQMKKSGGIDFGRLAALPKVAQSLAEINEAYLENERRDTGCKCSSHQREPGGTCPHAPDEPGDELCVFCQAVCARSVVAHKTTVGSQVTHMGEKRATVEAQANMVTPFITQVYETVEGWARREGTGRYLPVFRQLLLTADAIGTEQFDSEESKVYDFLRSRMDLDMAQMISSLIKSMRSEHERSRMDIPDFDQLHGDELLTGSPENDMAQGLTDFDTGALMHSMVQPGFVGQANKRQAYWSKLASQVKTANVFSNPHESWGDGLRATPTVMVAFKNIMWGIKVLGELAYGASGVKTLGDVKRDFEESGPSIDAAKINYFVSTISRALDQFQMPKLLTQAQQARVTEALQAIGQGRELIMKEFSPGANQKGTDEDKGPVEPGFSGEASLTASLASAMKKAF